MKNVCGKYPVTLTELKAAGPGGAVWRCFCRLNPPEYKSRTGRVCRWSIGARARRGERLFHLSGHRIAEMEPYIVTPLSQDRRFRAFGTFGAMRELLNLAVKTWNDLPNGREIETLFERMFPLKLELEITPLMMKPAKRTRRKAA